MVPCGSKSWTPWGFKGWFGCNTIAHFPLTIIFSPDLPMIDCFLLSSGSPKPSIHLVLLRPQLYHRCSPHRTAWKVFFQRLLLSDYCLIFYLKVFTIQLSIDCESHQLSVDSRGGNFAEWTYLCNVKDQLCCACRVAGQVLCAFQCAVNWVNMHRRTSFNAPGLPAAHSYLSAAHVCIRTDICSRASNHTLTS